MNTVNLAYNIPLEIDIPLDRWVITTIRQKKGPNGTNLKNKRIFD